MASAQALPYRSGGGFQPQLGDGRFHMQVLVAAWSYLLFNGIEWFLFNGIEWF